MSNGPDPVSWRKFISECKRFFGVNECKFLYGDNSLLNSYNSPADTIPMENHVIKNCEGCHQPLRIPVDIGGMLMRCPNCGHEFHTDFKLALKIREGGNGKEPAQKRQTKRPPATFKIIV